MTEPGQEPQLYVGYLSKMPKPTAQFLFRVVAGLFLSFIVAVFFLAYFQSQNDRGLYEFGKKRTYRGVLYSSPIPILRTTTKAFVLVGNGKFGAQEWVDKWSKVANGKSVDLQGTLIERDPIAMLEIDRDSPPKIGGGSDIATSVPPSEKLGEVQLQGELVDSKCYLGVMRPAVGKVHRSCAIRCLSGGVPPGILLRNQNIDASIMVLLVSENGQHLKIAPQWAGRIIRAKGNLQIRDGLPMLLVPKIELVAR